jgi:hypothetical protein
VNYEIISSLAREKRDELYEQAKNERAIRVSERRPRSVRRSIASAFETVGGACYKLSNALAER